jgi:DNA-directed RNA polymerase subunit RPC12/RpoP
MAGYKCLKCKKDLDLEDKVRCPFCGFRIVIKARPQAAKRVLAR